MERLPCCNNLFEADNKPPLLVRMREKNSYSKLAIVKDREGTLEESAEGTFKQTSAELAQML